MRSILLAAFLFILCLPAFNQDFSVITSSKIKTPNRQRFLRVVYSNETGCFVLEKRYKYLNFMYKTDMEQTLYKLDANCNIVFQKDYDKEFDGKSFSKTMVVKNELYGFISYYDFDEKKYSLSVTKISLKDGAVIIPPTPIASFDFLLKNEDRFTFSVDPVNDSTGFRIVINQSSLKENRIYLAETDTRFSEPLIKTIKYGAGKDFCALENVIVNDTNIIITTRNYDYYDEKKKRKCLKSFSITAYSKTGEKKKELFAQLPDKFFKTAKLFRSGTDQLMLAGFYSNEPNSKYTNGIFVYKIDIPGWTVSATGTKELNGLSVGYKQEGEKNAEKGLESYFLIKEIIPNPVTGGFVMVNESFWISNFSSNSYNFDPAKGDVGSTTTSESDYYSDDILMVDIKSTGEIGWVSDLPKRQVDDLQTKGHDVYDVSYGFTNAFSIFQMTDYPAYSSFTILPSQKGLSIIFNDHPKNADITTTSDKVKRVDLFSDSYVYAVNMDYATGKFTRKPIEQISNKDLILMPKTSLVSENTAYIISSRWKILGKGEFVVNKFMLQ